MRISLFNLVIMIVGFLPLIGVDSFAQSTANSHQSVLFIDPSYIQGHTTEIEKCATPIILQYLHQQRFMTENGGHLSKDQLEAEVHFDDLPSRVRSRLKGSSEPEIISNSVNEQTFTSSSGNFVIHYELSGANAVDSTDTDSTGIPDYVEKAANAADYSLALMVDELGYENPIPANGVYHIYFEDLSFYGYTIESSQGTEIYLHSNYEGFPENDHPDGDQLGALYATIAHELKHAIQYVTNEWEGEAGSFKWIEMDATMMEEIVFDEVNDYYNYLYGGSIFTDPDRATPGAYSHVTWSLYFSEQFGQSFWVETWKQFSTLPDLAYMEAVRRQLEIKGSTFEIEHLRNHLWHMTSGDQFDDIGYGFEERSFYPNATISETYRSIPDSALVISPLDKHAAKYIVIEPDEPLSGVVEVTLKSENPGLGVALLGWLKNGTTREMMIPPSDTQSLLEIVTDWRWDEVTKLGIVVGSFSDFIGTTTAEISSYVPMGYTLSQNYPNPFNPTTTIRFELVEQNHVDLEVYDVTGKRVATLLNKTLSAGVHRIEFDGLHISSGIYFYKLSTPSFTETKSMTLIK